MELKLLKMPSLHTSLNEPFKMSYIIRAIPDPGNASTQDDMREGDEMRE